tara:strand:- start:215 stop:445 length:231 start_codon:yes stop_codon:yes gene_type:complete
MLFKEEFAPLLFKLIAGVNNYTVDALNYLKMTEKLSDTIELEENLPCLTYTKSNKRHDGNQYIICNVGMELDAGII